MEKSNYQKNWYKKNKKKVLKQSKDWYEKNKDKALESSKNWYKKNKNKALENSKNWYKKNKERKNEMSKIWYENNKKTHNERNRIWRKNNKEKMRELCKEWYNKNKERVATKAKIWYENNKERKKLTCKLWYEKNKQRTTDRQRHKRKTNPSYRLLMNLRRRTLLALKGKCKSANTMTLLGIPNVEFLWNHLEKLFKPGMTRENHGKWHLDHVKPCSSFDLTKPEEQSECFHYTNLQPLWASENLSKGNRIS